MFVSIVILHTSSNNLQTFPLFSCLQVIMISVHLSPHHIYYSNNTTRLHIATFDFGTSPPTDTISQDKAFSGSYINDGPKEMPLSAALKEN